MGGNRDNNAFDLETRESLRGRSRNRPARVWFWITAWTALLLIALAAVDVRAAAWVGSTVPVRRLMWLFEIMKAPGHFGFTVLVMAAALILHRSRWRAAAFIGASGILAGVLCALVKWAIGRTRPLHNVPAFHLQPFRYGLPGLLHGENLSFPSGHTALAFATAAAMTILFPRGIIVFFLVAVIVASERVLQGSHYVGDVVAAAGLGVLSTYLVWIAANRIFASKHGDPMSGEPAAI